MLNPTFSRENSQKRPYFMFLGALIIILGSFLFVYNNVWAADDNLYPDVGDCAPLPIGENCDGNQTPCVSTFNFYWTANGYPGGAGRASCCGDDSQENILSCQTSSEGGISCGSNTQACCDINSKCVYNGACYARSLFNGVNTNDTSVDLEFCSGYFDHDLPSRWFDQDTDKSVNGSSLCETQGNIWFSSVSSCESGAGPGGVCDDADGGAFCCGDDSNENSKTCSVQAGATCNTTTNLCCNSATDKINAAGNCISPPNAPVSPAFKTNYCEPNYGGTDSYVEAYLIDNSTDETGFYIYRNTVNNAGTASLLQTLGSLAGTGSQIRFTDNTGANCT